MGQMTSCVCHRAYAYVHRMDINCTCMQNSNYILGVGPRQSSGKSSSTQLHNGSHPATFREGTVVTGNSSTQHLAAVNPTTCYTPGTHQLKWKGEPNSSEMGQLLDWFWVANRSGSTVAVSFS